MAVIYTPHFIQFFNDNGDPLSNGELYTFAAGTTTSKATYTTATGDIEHSNPIELDSAGRAQIFIQGSYRFDLYDSNGVLQSKASTDNVTSFTTLNESGEPFFESFSGTGSQTVFTLAESLGNDSKDIMVFLNDESGDVGYNIQNPSAYTLSGTSLTFSVAPPTGTNSIYVFAPTKLLGAASAAADLAEAAEASALAAQAAAEAAAGLLEMSSVTSLLIGTGSKVFTVAAGLGLTAGQFVLADSDADGSNYMYGQITSYSSTTLTVNVLAVGGSGTFADWTITLIGIQGLTGATGSISDISGVSVGVPVSGDTFIFTDTSDSNTTKKVDFDNMPSGAWVALETQTASSDTEIDFVTGIDSTYKTYVIIGGDIIPSVDADHLKLRTSTDGGSSFDSGAGNYKYAVNGITQAGSTDNFTSVAATSMHLIRDCGTGSGEIAEFSLTVSNPSNISAKTLVSVKSNQINDGDLFVSRSGGGLRNATGVVNALRLLFDTGNIVSGTFTLYGISGA